MRSLNKVFTVFVISILLFTMLIVMAGAVAGFSARPIFPENQREDTRAFFDLNVYPGQLQELSILLTNEDDVEIALIPQLVIATTNRVGDIVYVDPDTILHIPEIKITDLIHINESSIVIPAGEEYMFTFTLAIPDVEFDGILLGSVRLLRALTEEEAAAPGIVNQFAINTPIRIRQNDNEVSKRFYIQSVEADLIHFSASAVVNILNPQPRMYRNVTVTVEVFAQGDTRPIMQFHSENIGIAPESIMPLTVSNRELEVLEPGIYIAVISLEHGGDYFHFEERFEVTAVEAERISDLLVPAGEFTLEEAEDSSIPLWLILLIVGGALVLIGVVIIVVMMMKRMNQYKKLAEKAGATRRYNRKR